MQSRLTLFLIVATFSIGAHFPNPDEIVCGSDIANDGNTSCNATPCASLDEGSTPGGDWCVADNNNVSWSMELQMSSGLDLTAGTDDLYTIDPETDAQEIEIYVRQFDEGQTGIPTISIGAWYIASGGTCDTYEYSTSADTDITAAGYPGVMTHNFTWPRASPAGGWNSAHRVCVVLTCTKSGGSPAKRNSCDVDYVVWNAKFRSQTSFISENGERQYEYMTKRVEPEVVGVK